MKFKWSKNKIIASLLVIGVLILAFWYGGDAPGLRGRESLSSSEDGDYTTGDEAEEISLEEEDKKEDQDEESQAKAEDKEDKEDQEEEKDIEENLEEEEKDEEEKPKLDLGKEIEEVEKKPKTEEKTSKPPSTNQPMEIDPSTGKDKYQTDPVPKGKPVPIEPENSKITDVEKTCTLSVSCDTILDNMDWLDPEKVELVPKDGVIYASKEVKFYEGESVFNLLLREMKKSKIHMEFNNTPVYNSAYVQGINNLYEFDCGELSGWMYKVNDWFPNYGSSRYALKEGDRVEWVYTCNLGRDVEGTSAIGGE